MECRVLRFGYDTKGKPSIPGVDRRHGIVRERDQWWTLSKPAVDRIHPLLCHAWEEANGLFAIFAESTEWVIIDPANIGVSLSRYFSINDDWLTCRADGSNLEFVFSDIVAPQIVSEEPMIVESWDTTNGVELSIGESIFTVRRGSITLNVTCIEPVTLVSKYRNEKEEIKPGMPIAKVAKKERIAVAHRRIKLTEKPRKMPSALKPLIIDDFEIAALYPSILSSIGIGDRISEAENG